eukprot:2209977-Pyramimonas_sp.AAC.1
MTPIYCDRPSHVPKGHSARVRYDANANRYHTSLPGGPEGREVARIITFNYDAWEELDDTENTSGMAATSAAAAEKNFRAPLPDGPR